MRSLSEWLKRKRIMQLFGPGEEKKKIASLSDAHRDDGHLEFLEIRRVSGDYLGTRERNQPIIRLLSCFSSLSPLPPPCSLFLFPGSPWREKPLLLVICPMETFLPLHSLPLSPSGWPSSSADILSTTVLGGARPFLLFFFPSLKSNNVIHLSRLHSLRVLIVSTATDE